MPGLTCFGCRRIESEAPGGKGPPNYSLRRPMSALSVGNSNSRCSMTASSRLPAWGALRANTLTRADVRSVMSKINGPILANQVLASASAIFTWATKQELLANNPCRGVERNATVSRERVLSDTEVPLFWQAFSEAGVSGMALQVLL